MTRGSAEIARGDRGWTLNAALVTFAGIGLTFAIWWMYFAVPWSDVLRLHRERAFRWGYGHIVLFGALAAIGAGLHVAAYYLEDETEIGATATVLSVAIPVAVYVGAFYAIHLVVMRHSDPFHILLIAATAAVLVLGVLLAAAGVGMAVCLIVLMLAPVVTVVGYESVGHRHMASALARLRG